MKRVSFLQKVLAFAFTAIVLFTVSVHETHYLFAEHHAVHEHCENHLHGEDTHTDCAVCKFDVSFFTDNISYSPTQLQLNSVKYSPSVYHSVILVAEVSSNSLRGPPLFV